MVEKTTPLILRNYHVKSHSPSRRWDSAPMMECQMSARSRYKDTVVFPRHLRHRRLNFHRCTLVNSSSIYLFLEEDATSDSLANLYRDICTSMINHWYAPLNIITETISRRSTCRSRLVRPLASLTRDQRRTSTFQARDLRTIHYA